MCSLMSYAGAAVLEAIEQDQLQQNAHQLGTYLIDKLQTLQKVHHLLHHNRLCTAHVA